jgi:hypothetical protein
LTKSEYLARLKVYKDNAKLIKEHNSKGEKFTLTANKFADWTQKEYKHLLGMRPIVRVNGVQVKSDS